MFVYSAFIILNANLAGKKDNSSGNDIVKITEVSYSLLQDDNVFVLMVQQSC